MSIPRRYCIACDKWRVLSQFPRGPSGVFGNTCAPCAKIARARLSRECATCHIKRTITQFPRASDNTLSAICTPCARLERRRIKARPFGPTARHRALYRSYGLKPHF